MIQVYHVPQQLSLFTLPPTTKYCPDCKKTQSLEAFSIHSGKPYGYCKDCARKRDKARNRPYKRAEHRPNPRHSKPKYQSTREGYRFCNDCELEKPFEEFHLRKGKPIAVCILCERERERERHMLRRPRKKPPLPKATKPGYKVCNTCFNEKEYDEFNQDLSLKDEHASRCRECEKEQYENASPEEKEHRKAIRKTSEDARREEIRVYDRARSKTEKHRANSRRRVATRKMLDPTYRQAVRNALTEWREKNPLYVREYRQRQKIKQHKAREGRVDFQSILERDGMFCHICEMDIEPNPVDDNAKLTFDHIVPLHPRRGEPKGLHTEENLTPAHAICNARKNNRQMSVLTDYDRRGPYVD